MAAAPLSSLDALGDLRGKRVLVRSDLNTPLDKTTGQITDDLRIRMALPTIQDLRTRGARVVVCSHLGRPGGEVVAALSLSPVAQRMGELLSTEVAFTGDCVGAGALALVDGLEDGQVALLENLRFHAEETTKDDADRAAFAASLATLADAYVGDGFGVVHRKHASVYDVPMLLPHAMGQLVAAEVEVLHTLTDAPKRPYAVILGGSKVSDKLAVIDSLMERADLLIIGGGMCFTFLKALGHEVGTSLLQQDMVEECARILRDAQAKNVLIGLPVDIVAAQAFSADAPHATYDAKEMPADRMGLDIGPNSVRLFASMLSDAETIFWNGPMGVFELEPYAAGTRGVMDAIVDRTSAGAFSVVGGGDSAAAVRAMGLDESSFSHISTGGGASLEFLEGKQLPGLTALGA